MKTLHFQKARLIIIGLSAVVLSAGHGLAQDSTTAPAAAPASTATAAPATASAAAPAAVNTPVAASAPAPQLSYGVPEVLQMSRANVGDSVIVNYIQNSGNNYGLNAAQIIYLRQQGVSDAVINTMLNQRTQSAQIAATVPTPAPDNTSANPAPASTTTAQPAVAYVPATTASTVYVIPDTQTYNYNAWLYSRPYYPSYPYYGYYPYSYGWPAISLSFGFGFGGYYGGGYHNNGGYYGGWHGGNNGWHGGNNGWHGGNSGWHH